MSIDPNNLPDDPVLLKEMLLKLNLQNSHLEEKRNHLETEIDSLKNQLAYFRRMVFGKRSEKLSKEEIGQMLLFNESEDGADEAELEELKKEAITVPSHTRRKRGRKKLSEDILVQKLFMILQKRRNSAPAAERNAPVSVKKQLKSSILFLNR